MSLSTYYLNQRISILQSEIDGIVSGGVPTTSDLDVVLTNGNSAGTSDIDMNANDILAVDNIDLVTINGLAYPPLVSTIDITDNNTSAVFYPVFTNGAGLAKTLYADTTTTPISVNPSTGAFNVVDTLKLGSNNVGLGKGAGVGQGQGGIAIGFNCGTSQAIQAIAIGASSGFSGQGDSAIAIGAKAGQGDQSGSAIAIGLGAGNDRQLDDAIAIGRDAGFAKQGTNSIAIGTKSGNVLQSANSIVINATGGVINGDLGVSRCYIAPIRGVALGLGVGVVYYDTTTFELQYSTT